MLRWFLHLRRALWNSVSDDIITLSRAAAYSSILTVFPAILVMATIVAISPQAEFVRLEFGYLLYQMFPPDVPPVLLAYFQGEHARSIHLLLSASFVSLWAANSVMVTLMECSRRAYKLPAGLWSFWHQRLVAFLLVPLSLVPLMLASLFVVFGHQIEDWMIYQAGHDFRIYVLLFWRVVRWLLAMVTSVAVIATIYHMGTPRTQSWRRVMPGAVLATVLWFPSTLIFGWYVTRHANYTQVYGSLGAGIALLIWLYIILISVMIGAEFNAEAFPKPALASSPGRVASPAEDSSDTRLADVPDSFPSIQTPSTRYNDR
ncbi:MAG TPA: YihY/virulence factor BrkB family protein [Acidobacteriaceae bacterium]|jgi:membrane protein|nr:YihY/virulence factor BrkB family protein [Acidobacteriaceae bacterium]